MSGPAPTRRVRVAAVQMASVPGDVAANLRAAEAFVAEAAERGAELVLLPELAPVGYRLTRALWDAAEPIGGPITRAVAAMAGRHRVHLGTTLIEAKGAHFRNGFVLADPDGAVAGVVRKTVAPWAEARFYRGAAGPRVIETALGRIGVGICYDNYLGGPLRDLARAGVDLVLHPTAAATPPPRFPVGAGGARRFDRMLNGLAARHAAALGVPVAMANMAGPLDTPLPCRMGRLATRFPGLSSIADADGATLARLGAEEGVIVADVEVGRGGATRPPASAPPPAGRWAAPMPWYAPAWPATAALCGLAYRLDRTRAERALAAQRPIAV